MPGAITIPFLALTGLFVLVEGPVVHVKLRRQTLSISLSEIPLVLGLFFASPLTLVAARTVGGAVALVAWRRLPLVKAAFNTAMYALEACLAIIAFQAVVALGDPIGPVGWLGALVAGGVAIVVTTSAVAVAIQLTDGSLPPRYVRGSVTFGLPTTAVNVIIGLVTAVVLHHDTLAGILLGVLSVMLAAFYHRHARLQGNHENLSELYAITREVDDALERGDAIDVLLVQTAQLLQAEVAELVVDDAHPARYTWRAGDCCVVRTDAGTIGAEHRHILGGATARLLTPRGDRDALDRLGGYGDAIVVSLRGDEHSSATMFVADRAGDVATFTEDDVELFQTLATHASIALRTSALLARREHEALHDQLTGLPNRTLFDREVAARVAADPTEVLAVMLLDLDRFKEVNDTLGHPQGDRLLQIIAGRLRDALGDDGVVARFGGDEFAVLVGCDGDPATGIAVAERLREHVEQPVDLAGLPISVGASVGIAYAPVDGGDGETLLQRADVALYTAKGGVGVTGYDRAVDQYSPERLAMVAELRRAIERDELLVAYQPCIDLATGAVRSTEALARWHHPERGYVSPDVFVPIAERSGLIGPLTTAVLRSALRQCAEWRREGLELRVAVNLSARSLVDPDLPGDIERELRAADVPATALALEITESTIMEDPARTVGMLNKLSSMGVTLSIDDYGTGYSTLAYLKNLPVDELKLDRSFITHLRSDERDLVIVRNTIALAHELDLRVVAEGVEDAETLELLASVGCDLAQGFHISRPRTAAQLFDMIRGATRGPAPISLAERRRQTGTG